MSLINIFEPEILEFNKIPVVFLSFDEPNADENYRHLCDNHPNKKLVYRVHGVKGFDAAHKAAAEKAGTDRFFTVDADCIVSEDLWDKSMQVEGQSKSHTFSWNSINVINGLVYGNGGVKLWNANFVKEMRTHEASEKTTGASAVEFCWDNKYQQMNTTYGVVYNNASPYQAFRAGFREGVKMGLDQGEKVKIDEFKSKMYPANYARWLIWMSVGRDVENGAWAMYGARLGAYMLYVENFDHSQISNYEWFEEFWDKILIDTDHGKYLDAKLHRVLIDLVAELKIPLVEIDANQSIWFKHVNFNPASNTSWTTLLNYGALPLFGFETPSW